MSKKTDDMEGMIIGGTTLIGLGIGFIMLEVHDSGLLFTACLLIGVGAGLFFSSMATK